MGLELPTSLSPSKMTAFKECALAFRYANIDRLPEPPSRPAMRGTTVHRALELLMLDPPTERNRARAGVHLDTAEREMHESAEWQSAGYDADTTAAFRADADRLLDNYFALEDPATVHPIGLEVMLTGQLQGVVVRGILDRLELSPTGELIVTDYKTGRAPPERNERQRLLGVQFYAHLCEHVLGRRPSTVQLMYLANKQCIVARPSDQAQRGLRTQIGAVWNAIERSCERADFRPQPSFRCDWCAYKDLCPAHGGVVPERAGRNT